MSFIYTRIGLTNTCNITGLTGSPAPNTVLTVPAIDPINSYLVVGITNITFSPVVSNVGLNLSGATNLKTIYANACQNTVFSGNLVIPNSVETIGAYAFQGCGFNNGTLTLSTSLKTIGNHAFENCNFSGNLTIPSSVTSIGEYAFNNSGFVNGELIFAGSGSIPVITSLSRTSAPLNTNVNVVIYGSSLAVPISVFFGPIQATIVSYAASQIEVTVPERSSSSAVSVVVTTSAGSSVPNYNSAFVFGMSTTPNTWLDMAQSSAGTNKNLIPDNWTSCDTCVDTNGIMAAIACTLTAVWYNNNVESSSSVWTDISSKIAVDQSWNSVKLCLNGTMVSAIIIGSGTNNKVYFTPDITSLSNWVNLSAGSGSGYTNLSTGQYQTVSLCRYSNSLCALVGKSSGDNLTMFNANLNDITSSWTSLGVTFSYSSSLYLFNSTVACFLGGIVGSTGGFYYTANILSLSFVLKSPQYNSNFPSLLSVANLTSGKSGTLVAIYSNFSATVGGFFLCLDITAVNPVWLALDGESLSGNTNLPFVPIRYASLCTDTFGNIGCICNGGSEIYYNPIVTSTTSSWVTLTSNVVGGYQNLPNTLSTVVPLSLFNLSSGMRSIIAQSTTSGKVYYNSNIDLVAVSAITPTTGPSGTSVQLSGYNFNDCSSVLFGTSTVIPSSITPTSLTVVAPTAINGTVDTVQLTTPLAISAASTATYTYLNTPVINSLTPSSGYQAGGTVVTIAGSNFATPVTVTFGGVIGTNISLLNTNTITVTSPAGASLGVVTVVVTCNSVAAVPQTTGADQFTYTAPPIPVISSIEPQYISSVGSTNITINGTNFLQSATVPAASGFLVTNVSVVNSSKITCTITPVTEIYIIPIQVFNGTDGSNVFNIYTVNEPFSTILSPTNGAVSSTVTLTSSTFSLQGPIVIHFGTETINQFLSYNPSRYSTTFSVPSLTLGNTYNVYFTNVQGTPSPTETFYIDPPTPVISSITPQYTTSSTTSFVIAGSGFYLDNCTVSGGSYGTFTINLGSSTSSSLVVTYTQTSPGNARTAQVFNGTTPSNIIGFYSVVAPNTVTSSILPVQGTVGSSAVITTSGPYVLEGPIVINFGGQTINQNLTWDSARTSTVFTIPSLALGIYNVYFTNVSGNSNTMTFEIVPQPPEPPGQPTNVIVTPTPGGGGATVSFTAPLTGGQPLSYTLAANAVTKTIYYPDTSSTFTNIGSPTGITYSFTVTAVNSSGNGPASTPVTATIYSIPVSSSLTPFPTVITDGDALYMTPVFSGATIARISYGSQTIDVIPTGSGNQVQIQNPPTNATTNYTLYVLNDGWAASPLAFCTVTSYPAPAIGTFTATPQNITIGGSSVLQSTNTVGELAYSSGGGSYVQFNSPTTVSPTITTNYVLKATNPIGAYVIRSVTVFVYPVPVITSFTVFVTGNTATLIPVFPGTNTGFINNGIGTVVSGQTYTQTISTTTTYTLTVTNPAGAIVTDSKKAIVNLTQENLGNEKFSVVVGQTVFTPIQPVVAQGGTGVYTYSIVAPYPIAPYPNISMASNGVVTITDIIDVPVGNYTFNVFVHDSDSPQQTLNTSFILTILAQPAPNIATTTLIGANYTDLTNYEKAYVVNAVAQRILQTNPGVTVLYVNLSNGSVITEIGTNLPIAIPEITITIDGITLTNVICLLETSNIKMADGSYKNIKDVVAGDMVRSALNGADVRVLYCGSTMITSLSDIPVTNHPYCIPVNFFGDGHPSRDTLISGHHRVFFKMNENIVGIQVFKLMTDTQPLTMDNALSMISSNTLRYFHIGVEGGKNAVFCDGIPVETLDEGEW